MELLRRTRGDELIRPGELLSLRQRLRRLAQKNDLVTVIACAFDHRTRMLPFIYADTRMAPAEISSDSCRSTSAAMEASSVAMTDELSAEAVARPTG